MSSQQPNKSTNAAGNNSTEGDSNIDQTITATGGSIIIEPHQTSIGKIEVHIPPEEPSSRPIPWPEVKSTCQEKSSYHLTLLQEKYNSELYVERKSIREHVDRFIKSDDTCYLMLNGQSGMGKTALLCKLEEDFRDDPDIACLIYDGNNLGVSKKLEGFSFLDHLAQGCLPPRDDSLGVLLTRIENAESFKNGKRKLIIIVDAINESKNMDAIIQRLVDLQREKVRHWIKVIVSCRPHVWSQICDRMTLSESGNKIALSLLYKPSNVPDRFIEVTRFSTEEAAQAYENHQRLYKFTPKEFKDLAPALQSRLREPLILWLVSEMCAQGEVSRELVGSDIQVIPEYTKQILEQRIPDSDKIEKATFFLENTLPKLMVVDQNCYNTVSLAEFRGKPGEIDEFSSMPDEIDEFKGIPDETKTKLKLFLAEGLLVKTADWQIRFRYERFYDYYFGLHLRRLANAGVQPKCRPIEYSTG